MLNAAACINPVTTEAEIKLTRKPSWSKPSELNITPMKKANICASSGDEVPLYLEFMKKKITQFRKADLF